MNIFYYIAYYIYLIIFKLNTLFNTLINKISSIKIYIIYIKNFFFYNEIIRYINYEIIT